MESITALTPDTFLNNTKDAKELLFKEKSNIPIISNWKNFDGIKNMQLVRFRGLIQDMLDPEIYLETYEVKTLGGKASVRNGKYRDILNLEPNTKVCFESVKNVYAERRPMILVSIPGLNEWAVDIENNTSKLSFGENSLVSQIEEKNQPSSIKDSNLPHVPIPERSSNVCLVKFYDDTSNISLINVIEVIGFTSFADTSCDTNVPLNDFEDFRVMPKFSATTLHIHAVSYELKNHLNPLMYNDCDWMTNNSHQDCLRILRTIFTQCFFGDEIAANYLICNLISNVYIRNDETLGQFAVNVTNFPAMNIKPSSYIKLLYSIIESLLPASHYFEITISSLNGTEFIPRKDYDTGKLKSGLLQLAPSTQLVLDETCLEEGKLESTGIDAIQNIKYLIKKQQLNVDFKFYQIPFDVDIPILIFSEGKSIFPSDCHIPLKPEIGAIEHIEETFLAVKQFLKPKIKAIRSFLTDLRLKSFDMNPENMQMIQNDIVEMRRKFNASADDLHLLMVLSRLIGIIEGREILEAKSWEQAKTMEMERRERILKINKHI